MLVGLSVAFLFGIFTIFWVAKFLYGKEHSRCLIYLTNGKVIKTKWKLPNKNEIQGLIAGDTSIIDDSTLITILSTNQMETALIKIQFKRRLF